MQVELLILMLTVSYEQSKYFQELRGAAVFTDSDGAWY